MMPPQLLSLSEQRNKICQHFFGASSVSAKQGRFYYAPHFGNEEIGPEKVRPHRVRMLEKSRARIPYTGACAFKVHLRSGRKYLKHVLQPG